MKEFTKERTNKLCCELFGGEREFTDDASYALHIVEKYEIDLLYVNRLKGKFFWLTSIKFKNDKRQFKHCYYEHADLKMAIYGVWLIREGYLP